ncbi:hypothetical protein K8R61_00270 [bacterium]|nr:hypothetical protein [bacterium]
MKNAMSFLKSVKAVVEDHFVFKAGYMHGNLYINKEVFSFIGAKKLTELIGQVVNNAVEKGLQFGDAKEVGVIGPAYGAIPFALTVSSFLEGYFPGIKFFPARTQLKEKDKRDIHYLPAKLIKSYHGKIFIGIEDIVNNGTTIREVSTVFSEQANAKIIAFLCFVNRANQTAETLGIDDFYPLMNPTIEQYDVRDAPCPQCAAGVPINTELGKGSEWVKIFGQPPYPEGMDFSSFWQERHTFFKSEPSIIIEQV